MGVKIRLRRMGKRDQPVYRIVVAEEGNKRDGKVIETIGQYHPKEKNGTHIKRDVYDAWLKKGAQPTDAVRKILQ